MAVWGTVKDLNTISWVNYYGEESDARDPRDKDFFFFFKHYLLTLFQTSWLLGVLCLPPPRNVYVYISVSLCYHYYSIQSFASVTRYQLYQRSCMKVPCTALRSFRHVKYSWTLLCGWRTASGRERHAWTTCSPVLTDWHRSVALDLLHQAAFFFHSCHTDVWCVQSESDKGNTVCCEFLMWCKLRRAMETCQSFVSL